MPRPSGGSIGFRETSIENSSGHGVPMPYGSCNRLADGSGGDCDCHGRFPGKRRQCECERPENSRDDVVHEVLLRKRE